MSEAQYLQPLLQDLISLLQKQATNEHYSLQINILSLVNFDVNLAETLCERPTETLLLFDNAALTAQQQIVQQEHLEAVAAVKDLVHVRLWGVPFHLDHRSSSLYPSIGNIRSCHVNKLITVTGTVVRSGSVTMIESHKLYQCARCYARYTLGFTQHTLMLTCRLLRSSLKADLLCRVLVPINPDTAEAPPPSGPCQTKQGLRICNSSKFKPSTSTLLHTNYQEIKIQEDSKSLPVGSVPRSICVLLQDDLADTCQTGGKHRTT